MIKHIRKTKKNESLKNKRWFVLDLNTTEECDSLEEAMDKVYGEIEVESSRLAIIPYGSKEKLAYEFYGNSNGDNYYIYIDTKTGKELEIFKVIKTTEGTLLM